MKSSDMMPIEHDQAEMVLRAQMLPAPPKPGKMN